MAASGEHTMEHEGEQQRFTGVPKIDQSLMTLSSRPTSRVRYGLRYGRLAPQLLSMGIRESKRTTAVPPCERAAVKELLILELQSTGHICEHEHDDILLYPFSNGTGNRMAIACVARDAMPKFLRIISGLCKLLLPEFAGTSTLGSRLEGMMRPLACGVDSLKAGSHHGMRMVEPKDLILDSGASCHVVSENTLLHGYQSLPHPWAIHVADGYPLEVVGCGSIKTKEFFIPKVFRAKGLKSNLISVSQLATEHGLMSVFDGDKCEVSKRDWERVGGGFLEANGIYKLRFLEVPETDASY